MDRNVTPKLSLTRLPRDILLCIVDAILEKNYDHPVKWSWDPDEEPEPRFNPLQTFRDALSLAATCKTLYTDLTGGIYRKDVEHNGFAALLSDVVALLLERGADIDRRVRLDSRSQLEIIYFNDPEQAAYLYPAGFCCDLVRRNISSGGAFLQSVNKAVAIWTLEHGASPLYFAIKGGDLGTSRLLIEKGASLDTHLGTRVHALHQAVANCDVNLVEFLLSINQVANRINTIQDGRRGSALHCLNYDVEEVRHANCQIIKLLVSHGCRLDILNNYNNMPVDEAANDLCRTAVAELIRHGSHLPRFLTSYGRVPEEISVAIGEVLARGLTIPKRNWNTMISSEIRGGWWMYPHFYKFVHRTNSIPVPLSGFTLFQWILYWEARPFAYTVLPGQESMLQALAIT
ncbi:uncharacterized protein FIESC28_08888 [Fusarium coffeatum]|uniref:Uncharacterized protein n=1 Tax=Fusarium coffeatum TaxID=231269 RepID=A0A366R3C1_9HYPO|nr:uncharacterized protein FIESC28_08888 [Fusarium coffeatum]RBR11661.1 hypothetical protein FIESC28_08888 [Fusarium coffeatum]